MVVINIKKKKFRIIKKKNEKWELIVPRRNSPDPHRSDMFIHKLLKGRDLEVLVKKLKVNFFHILSNNKSKAVKNMST